jgi:hypothetical protein
VTATTSPAGADRAIDGIVAIGSRSWGLSGFPVAIERSMRLLAIGLPG